MGSSLLRLIKERRSVRRYITKPVSGRHLKRVLEAGRWAPSGLNNQPWRFAVIRDTSLKKRLAKLTESASVVRSADVIISVFLDKKTVYNRTKDIQAIGAAMQNMLLEAHSLGLGSCWLGEILNKKEKVCRLLKAPSGYELMGFISLGWPKRKKRSSKRKRLDTLIYNTPD
jgi:nitroreductase